MAIKSLSRTGGSPCRPLTLLREGEGGGLLSEDNKYEKFSSYKEVSISALVTAVSMRANREEYNDMILKMDGKRHQSQ